MRIFILDRRKAALLDTLEADNECGVGIHHRVIYRQLSDDKSLSFGLLYEVALM